MKNIWTIAKKELTRVFTDKKLIASTFILPGLIIFLLYSILGDGIARMSREREEIHHDVVVVYENNPLLDAYFTVLGTATPENLTIELKEISDLSTIGNDLQNETIALAITLDRNEFMEDVIILSYNATNDASTATFNYANQVLSLFPISIGSNEFHFKAQNLATAKDMAIMAASMMLPFLIMTYLFQGANSLGPESIAGDKERGTIATLLATPTKRYQIALGKVTALSIMCIISALSSFVGIILSLPKMMQMDESLSYAFIDYVNILLIFMSTIILVVGIVSVISSLAKNVKEATTYNLPMMFVSMIIGGISMFVTTASTNAFVYLIPIYNCNQVLVGIFTGTLNPMFLAISCIANLAYAAILITLLTRIFNSERIMFAK